MYILHVAAFRCILVGGLNVYCLFVFCIFVLIFLFCIFYFSYLYCLPGCIQVSGGFQFTAYFGIKGYVQRALAIVRLEIQIKPESFLFLLFLNGSSFPFLQHSIEIGVRLLALLSDCYLELFLIQHVLNWTNISAKKRKCFQRYL